MHDTAMIYGKCFFDTYLKDAKDLVIVDVGAQDVNGSLRALAPKNNSYIGVDFEKGNGVDIVISDPYRLPQEDESVDVVVSSSCLEHSEFFWLSFNEMLRILKPSGLLYLNVPSNGDYHRYPVDCWRFFPDSGIALQNWGRRSGYNCSLLESFVGVRKKDVWHDFISVFVKDQKFASEHQLRIQNNINSFSNGRLLNSDEIVNQVASFHKIKIFQLRALKKIYKKIFGNN